MARHYYLKIPKIAGEATDKDHANEISLRSWKWAAENKAIQSSEGKGGRGGKGECRDLEVTFVIQKSFPLAAQFCLAGQHIKGEEVILTCRRATGDGDKHEDYFWIKMKDVFITSLRLSTPEGDDAFPVVTMTLNCGAIKWEFTPEGANKPEGATWNILTNSKEY